VLNLFSGGLVDMPEDQRALCNVLGRKPWSFSDTPGDGDCCLLAVAQAILYDGFKGQPKEVLMKCAEMMVPAWRTSVAKELTSHPVFTAGLVVPEHGSLNPMLESLVKSINEHTNFNLPINPSAEDIINAITTPGADGGACLVSSFEKFKSKFAMLEMRNVAGYSSSNGLGQEMVISDATISYNVSGSRYIEATKQVNVFVTGNDGNTVSDSVIIRSGATNSKLCFLNQAMEARLPLCILKEMSNIIDEDEASLIDSCKDGTAINDDGIAVSEVYVTSGNITKVRNTIGNTTMTYLGPTLGSSLGSASTSSKKEVPLAERSSKVSSYMVVSYKSSTCCLRKCHMVYIDVQLD
jgi:hypothetical protein